MLNATLIDQGQARVVCLLGGVRPVFSIVDYLDHTGVFLPDITFPIDDAAGGTDNVDTVSILSLSLHAFT